MTAAEVMENGVDVSSSGEDGVVEPDFSDPPGFVDEHNEDELIGDVLRQKPSDTEYEYCSLIIEGIPEVTEDKLKRLKDVLSKILKRFNESFQDHYPIEDGKTKGYCFVEYPNRSSAAEAAAVLNGYQLDKNHRFSANLFADLNKFTEPDRNWKAPTVRPYKDLGDLWWWLQNPKCLDQFVVHYEREDAPNRRTPVVGVYWNMPGSEPALVGDQSERLSFTETIVEWSPYGTYLATFHQQGVALWCGQKIEQFQRFQHEKVSHIDFSPHETYLVTYGKPSSPWNEDESVRVWHVQTGVMKRGFNPGFFVPGRQGVSWPYFQWSHDEKYFACLKPGGGGISIYETDTFGLVELGGRKQSLLIENLKDFKWSPMDRNIAYFVAEEGESKPSMVSLMSFPERKERTVRVFRMAEATLYWQKSGHRLAVRNDRYTKKKLEETGEVKYSGTTCHLEIFYNVHAKDIPVYSQQLTEQFVAFGWEPNGDKFCVLTGSSLKATPHIYRASDKGVSLMTKLDPGNSMALNTVLWAPAGGWLALIGLKTASGNMLFVDTNTKEKDSGEAVKMGAPEHPFVGEASWDSTGRYFATSASQYNSKSSDLGYQIYSFQGKELVHKRVDLLAQFIWRPRPPIKVPEEKLREVRRNMKTLAAKFEADDKYEKGRASKEVIEKRRAIMLEFDKFRKVAKQRFDDDKKERMKLRGGLETDVLDMHELEEETIEVPLSTEKVIVEKRRDDEE